MLSPIEIVYFGTVLGYIIKLSELTDPGKGMIKGYRDLILNKRFVSLLPFPLDLVIVRIARLFKV